MLNKTFPPGRLVAGNPYRLLPQTDNNNKPKLGADGKQMHSSYVAVAIKKTVPAGQWWWHEPWGAEIYQLGAADMPQNYQHPDFAWKIEDGDSVIPNKKMKKNADREGWPGHWVIKASSTFLPQVCTLLDPSKPGKPVTLLQENAIKTGDFVQLAATIAGNKRTDSPGIYINPAIVCLVGYGQAISFGIDPEEAGFGGQPLPEGASAVPVGMSSTPAAPPASAAPAPPAPHAAPPPAPVPVVPHTAITAPPPPPLAPAPPPAPATTPGSKYNRSATWPAGATDAAMEGAGWNEQSLRQHGYIV